ncbi:MAG: heavy metal translocating P-type ATPase [Chloroflexota bacterium]
MRPEISIHEDEKLTTNKQGYEHEYHDDLCINIINQAVGDTPGIMGVRLDPDQQHLSFDYDPNQISQPTVAQLAQQISPTLQQNMATCTMRLHRRGGRLCESCAAMLEGRVSQIEGVRQATASYTGGVLSVTYDNKLLSPAQLLQSLKQFGVSVAPSYAELPAVAEVIEPTQTRLQRAQGWLTRQRWEAIFTSITLITMSLGWLAEHFSLAPPVSMVLYVMAYVTGGTFGLKAGLESLRERTIDVDLLMVLAALGAAMVGAPFEGAMLLFLFSLSNVLQAYALDRTRNAIRALMKLRPEQALVRRGGRLVNLPVEKIVIGDRFVLRPGDRIPLDGVVEEGESAVDQASITGESMPAPKGPGDPVLAGTINQNGSLEARVTRLAKDSTIAKMIKLVEEAQSQKAQTQRFLDTAEQYYALGVIVFTILAAAIPVLFLGEAFQTAFYRAMTVMVAASPCALVISTPASILSAIGNGARKGVLFKGGVYMEQAAGIKVVAFDKTGTLTEGKPQVTDVKVLRPESNNGLWRGNEDDLLALAAAVEARSEHVLAQATVEAAQKRNLTVSEAVAFEAATGKGVRGIVAELDIRVGSLRYFEEFHCLGLDEAGREVERLQAEGKTSVVVAQMIDEGRTAHLLGVIAYADRLRANSAAVVAELKSLGVERVVMLTGDNERIARAIAGEVGVDEYYADLLPEDKVRLTQELEERYGAVAMVGDGVNDAPALARASIGIAMGAAGTDVALETADVVLLSDDLSNIPYVIDLSRQTRKTLITNLGFASLAILVMLAAIFSASFPLPLAVLGHEGGTVLVSLNGLRLLIYKRRRGIV